MPRPKKFPPSVYRHSSGQAFFRWEGRTIYLGVYGSAEAATEYARQIAAIQANGGHLPAAKATTALTVSAATLRFLEHAESHYSDRSREVFRFRRSLAALVAVFGSMPAADFGPVELETLQAAMASGSWMTAEEKAKLRTQKHPIGWCRNVVNRQIVRVRTCWRWLERKRLVPAGSTSALETVPSLPRNTKAARQTRRVKPATWEQVKAVLPFLCPAVRDMVLLQWFAGMRSCEVRTMRLSEIDRSDPACWWYVPAQHKTEHLEGDRPRTIPLGHREQRILRKWIRADYPDAYLFTTITKQAGKVRVGCYSAVTYPKALRRACDKSGVSFRPYQLRHGAKRRITRAAGLDTARAVLGHRSLGTTNEYASEVDLELAREFVKKTG